MLFSSNPAEKLILALDGMSKEESFSIISKLPDLKWVKVGLELFVSSGPDVVFDLRNKGLKVFLDLKFHDIPITMAGACRQAAKSGAHLITVHACAGLKALKYAKDAAIEGAAEIGLPPPNLLAVTVLTSWDKKTFETEMQMSQNLKARVELLADLAFKAEIGGCVCSPLEAQSLRRLYPEPFLLVTPGVRPENFALLDQSRVMSPASAIKAGASHLVIGRPLTLANDPVAVFDSFCEQISSD